MHVLKWRLNSNENKRWHDKHKKIETHYHYHKKNQKNKALYCINYFVTIIQNSVLKRFVFKHLGFFLMKDYMRSFLERLEKMTKTSHKHIDQSHVYTYYCFLQIPSSSSVMTCKFLWLLQTWGNLLSNQFHMYSVRFEKAFHWLAFAALKAVCAPLATLLQHLAHWIHSCHSV